jgi:hypothetical protein
MDHFTNFFELHVGFSTALGDPVVTDFCERIRRDSADWARSEVRSAHVTQAGCFDPHNVPGTLGWLVSRKVFQNPGGWSKTIDSVVLPAAAGALEALSDIGAEDARLEIEFPFGCFAATVPDNKIFRSAWTNDPVSISVEKINFPCGKRMSDVPEWEIHFLFEKIPKSSAPDMSVEEVSSFIARYGVDIEQTIEYRSAAMIGAARSDYRLIATSYFPDSTKTLKEAEHLFYDTKLCDDAYESGYTVRLILEHIVSCLQPNCDRN